MINITMIVKNILKQQGISNIDLVRRINKIEEVSGVRERTTKQNVTNYLNGYHNIGYDVARKMELALNLKDKTLLNMLPTPRGAGQKKQYKEALNKWKRG